MGYKKKHPLLRIFEKCIAGDRQGCLIWTGARSGYEQNYGCVFIEYSTKLVHKYVYEQLIGPVPDGLELDHIVCDNSLCVMPFHMKPVTCRDNVLRSNNPCAINARKIHCPYGHMYDEYNTYIRPSRPNNRECKICLTIRNK